MRKIIVAIDGHSSCGKSTMAKDLAREVGYIYVDTGAMYRAVTLFALRQGLFSPDGGIDAARLETLMPEVTVSFRLDEATGLPLVCLNGECVERDIRGLEVSAHVSLVAALPFVREALTRQQQAMGRERGLVMDGRDIGTVVFPDAELKVFVTASAEVRAAAMTSWQPREWRPTMMTSFVTCRSVTTLIPTVRWLPCVRLLTRSCSTIPC